MRANEINSAEIGKVLGNVDLTRVASIGKDDTKLTLWRSLSGMEVIETNAAPVWDSENGFAELKLEIEAGNDPLKSALLSIHRLATDDSLDDDTETLRQIALIAKAAL